MQSSWSKDPADQRYARFLGDEMVCDHDERFSYLALADTPTGDVTAGNEWLIRGRVAWQDGAVVRRTGWWLRFDDTQRPDPSDWWAASSHSTRSRSSTTAPRPRWRAAAIAATWRRRRARSASAASSSQSGQSMRPAPPHVVHFATSLQKSTPASSAASWHGHGRVPRPSQRGTARPTAPHKRR